MAKQQPHSLRRDHTPHSISDPYPDPTDTEIDGWSARSRHNWRAFMQPVHERLPDEFHRNWYRRIYRPNYTNVGVQERDTVSSYNEEDYVAEYVATELFESKQFLQPKQRSVSKIRYNGDLDSIADTIVDVLQDAISARPDGDAPSVSPDGDFPIDEIPLTPALALGYQRQPE